jgi:hypothetical protein
MRAVLEKRMHINLAKMARKILNDPPLNRANFTPPMPTNYEEILLHLQQDRLHLTDWQFRQRYAHWL